ncbi:HEAT repeat-containing protein 6 isoform X2 [Octopus sinensis]|uniref:HEAT repeat-containing protein 6 n=1 Tax=Octopus sinensis TaxID=2607531 RepID=A0A7E6FP04_9MOLL|nr:HEAT repeat-containing protein 6 isoform X2 [Octopus sinensis]
MSAATADNSNMYQVDPGSIRDNLGLQSNKSQLDHGSMRTDLISHSNNTSQCSRPDFLDIFHRLMQFPVDEKQPMESNARLNKLMDEINPFCVGQSVAVFLTEEGNQLLCKLCMLIPYKEECLVMKFCHTIFSVLTNTEGSLEDKCFLKVTNFLIHGLEQSPKGIIPDILSTLAVVLHDNGNRLKKFYELLLGETGLFVELCESTEDGVLKGLLCCLENITLKSGNSPYMEEKYVSACIDIFLKILYDIPGLTMDILPKCRILCHTLRGLHNIVLATRSVPLETIGLLLSAVWNYVFYGLASYPLTTPQTLYPIPMSQYNPSVSSNNSAKVDTTGKQPQKKKKKKKLVPRRQSNPKDTEDDVQYGNSFSLFPSSLLSRDLSNTIEDPLLCNLLGNLHLNNELSGRGYVSSSESELSDSDTSQVGGKHRSHYIKVRQAALGTLYIIFKFTDRKVIFGYWMCFVPDVPIAGNIQQVRSILTIILRDPSPKCRLGALGALSALIEGTRPFLAAAEYTDQVRTAFMPFSLVLGSTLKELHRSLLLAVVSENYPLTLTQLVKCISTLVANSPYHRLKPGLLTRIVKQLKYLVRHRDPNIRVACLTCFGAIVSLQPALAEVCYIVQSLKPPSGGNSTTVSADCNTNGTTEDAVMAYSKEFQFTGDGMEGEVVPNQQDYMKCGSFSASEPLTPIKTPSGLQTPVIFQDKNIQNQLRNTSWLITLCVQNILPQQVNNNDTNVAHTTEPVPIRLESLQILAHLTKNYFPMIRKNVGLLRNLIQACMEDSEGVLKLHAIKLLDELTQVLSQDLQNIDNSNEPNSDMFTVEQVLEFWEYLLNGPLLSALQCEENSPVCAAACDCLSNIGSMIFPLLPRHLRILCVTSVLGLTMGGDKLVMASAVRTIGVYVLQPCLRDDLSFMSDAAHTILTLAADQSTTVRMKATWALANFCDALAINRENQETQFIEDFSDSLLVKLFEVATKASQNNDKIRSNGVRALGNLLCFISEKSLRNPNIQSHIETAVKCLVENASAGIMKVRWNACYALSNLLKNSLLPHGEKTDWSVSVYCSLSNTVQNCSNFKVRINAALALGTPTRREQYGQASVFANVWNALILGLISTNKVTDFSEFRHRDTLIGQICTTILHLAVLFVPADLEELHMCLPEQATTLASHLSSYKQNSPQNIPQITSEIKKVINHLEYLDRSELSMAAQEALDSFQAVLLVEFSESNNEDKSEKSFFKQIYD